MAPVKRDQRAKAALPAKLTRSTTAISKTLRGGRTIERIVKSQTVYAELNSKIAPCKEFEQMKERLR